MSAKKTQKPVLGQIFSSDSSEEETKEIKATLNSIKIQIPSFNENKKTTGGSIEECSPPEGYQLIDNNQIRSISSNTLIQYVKHDGKCIKSKYFKKYDHITKSITVGFYTHGKRNYSETLENIKYLYAAQNESYDSFSLKETIEIPKEQWKTNLRRDMVISYEKENGELIYRAKFNSFLNQSKDITKLSLTSERGFNYIANINKISKMYRHVTGNDKTLTYILEAIGKLEQRISKLESRKSLIEKNIQR